MIDNELFERADGYIYCDDMKAATCDNMEASICDEIALGIHMAIKIDDVTDHDHEDQELPANKEKLETIRLMD